MQTCLRESASVVLTGILPSAVPGGRQPITSHRPVTERETALLSGSAKAWSAQAVLG
ncbi:hypothetical protein CCHR01_15143 [Colletotrichum chrysophilum]|uniref:Uncharacterized protein n=1 Tax=Colletotrichum chrysophilum TaxID=1836956 RepID=A0AAD9EB91_9PEZI|nr:hypothetical protein CCHR01_15143 [Colletotrichum chrysophilum]